ncbi:hypothetical protein C2S51_001747 [Perilla frutescens var. frutescens]|nr:hypothetical protein C2S51_001747 [Perilla frutescens var. frutescens]
MVGSFDMFHEIRSALIENMTETAFVAISGMAGIGKTTLARRVFNDSLVSANFECRAFVTVGQMYKPGEILQAIIAQVNRDHKEGMRMIAEENEDLNRCFKRSLKGRKYLIVLDDIWNDDFYVHLQLLLPLQDNGSRILLVSREPQSAAYVAIPFHKYKIRFLNDEESWDLLRRKVFGNRECPHQLVKAGKKIAENCEGLPLLIVAVAKLLSEAQNNVPEFWNEVAEKQNSIFEDACGQISEVLISSYNYLPQYLKMSFLYMVVFPQKHTIHRSKIENIWWAEGIGNLSFSLPFNDLVSRNLAVVRGKSSNVCSLHAAYWYLIKRLAENNKVVHILNSYADGSVERVQSHRCLAMYKNVLLAIKEVHNSIGSISTVRSLLCTGPYHPYQVPVCSDWRLLRTLDALTIRFYEFPLEVVKLILLRYLALTCNADLPPCISKLWNLEFLIVHQHVSIKRVLAADDQHSPCVPEEIWDLQELKHLQIVGRNLPNPPLGKVLPNLTELLDVGAQRCYKRVLQSIPNLKKLRIQIEFVPNAAQTMSCFDHISCLQKLESLITVIVNPKILLEPIVPPLPFWNSIYSLKKLSLGGFGYPWEDMSKIAELPSLEELKLKCYAFRGDIWEAEGRRFSKLRYLIIEDTDLVQWAARDETFPQLSWLTMKNCHKLREIPRFSTPLNVELVDCNPLAETCVDAERVHANYSWK